MSATNSTPTIGLPLFIGTDKPAWLVDFNGAMNTIDSAIATLQTAEGGTASSLASLSQSVEALSGTVSQHTTSLQTITTAVAGNTGSINTINSLIGNGQPTTEDKTIIGAINEIYAEIGSGDGIDASEVSYDNTQSGLTADDVQAAINEVVSMLPQGGVDADDVAYDNTDSGMTATNVQDAIDELASGSAVVDWTLKGTETGTTPISISSTAKEVYCVVNIGTTYRSVCLIPRVIGDCTVFATGGYANSSFGASILIDADFTNNSIKINAAHRDTSDITSTATISVYER